VRLQWLRQICTKIKQKSGQKFDLGAWQVRTEVARRGLQAVGGPT
jgi:hypothetical protein